MTLAEELVRKWGDVISDLPVPTWTEPHCLAYCAEVASKSRVGVEIGTYMGMSALVMLRANPNLHLWCVDIFTAFEFNEQVAAYFLRDYIKQGRCELIKGNSDKAAEMLKWRFLDFAFIDGGHDTETVKKDIANFLPIVREDGELMGHDFDLPHNDVALGVIASLPPGRFICPVPRLWSYKKP